MTYDEPSDKPGGLMRMEMAPYKDTWAPDDPHANFKAEVARYTVVDPLPTLEGLSRATGVPVPCLARYVLVRYAASCGDALLTMGPVALEQMREHVTRAEEAGTDSARLEAYEALRQIVSWLLVGAGPTGRSTDESRS